MSNPTRHIAVIDDDESYCRSVVRLLRAAAYLPTTYHSAEAFLADAERPPFSCLLLDVSMEGMSGIDLGRRLADSGSTTPVIYVTAHDDDATRVAAQAAGCVAFISKVESSGELLRAIASLLKDRSH
jgi:FixJ family two-component response regulator